MQTVSTGRTPTPEAAKGVNITPMIEFIGSFRKGTAVRNYAGDYCDWLLRTRSDEPRWFDYLVSARQARNIRHTAEYLYHLAR